MEAGQPTKTRRWEDQDNEVREKKRDEVMFPCSLGISFVRARHTPIWGNREKEIVRSST